MQLRHAPVANSTEHQSGQTFVSKPTMPATESGYAYRPLTEPGAIRLIELPRSEDLTARLECALIHTTLNDMNDEVVYHYCALSYVWGNPENKKCISVDGRELHITANLEEALRYLRDPRLVRYIWADAICINQNDDTEKAFQVSQMGDVYKAALHTIIWLGAGTEDDGAEHILASVRDEKKASQASKASDRSDKSPRLPQKLNNPLLPLERLTGLPWFSRVWIYQELILSPDPWLQIRRTKARWADVSRMISLYLELTSKLSEPCTRFLAMDKARKDFHAQSQGRNRTDVLFDTLTARRGLGVFDARDMIFAHLGIVCESPLDVSPDVWDLVGADYKKDCAELYRNVAHCLSLRIDIFKILSHVEARVPDHIQGTPSWAPNWMIRAPPLRYGKLSDSVDVLRRRYESKYGLLDDRLDNSNGSLLLRTLPDSYKLWLDELTITFLGFRMGSIARLSTTEMTYDELSFTTTPQVQGELHKNSNRIIYNRWWEVFSGLLEDKSEYDAIFRSGIAKFRANSLYDLTLTSDDFFIHALLHESRPNDSTYPDFLCGRKLALVPGCGFAVVPTAAKIGDVVCFFLEKTTLPFLLRPQSTPTKHWLEDDIRFTFKPRNTSSGKSLPVNYFEFIGECILVNFLFASFDGRYFSDLSGEHYPGTLEAFVIQ